MGSNATEICVSISVKIASLYTTRSCDGFSSGWCSINSAYKSTCGSKWGGADAQREAGGGGNSRGERVRARKSTSWVPSTFNPKP